MKKNISPTKFQTSTNKFEIKNSSTRLREAIQKSGGNNLISAKAGIPLGTLNGYISGRSGMKVDAAAALADACGVSLEWLIRGIEPDNSSQDSNVAFSADAKPNYEMVDVPFVSTEASAGFGIIASQENEIEYVQVSRDFLYRCLGLVPKGIIMIRVVGDSMTPTISPNDRLIVDTTPCSITHGVYIMVIHEAVYVKRLGLQDVKNFKIISDNPQYSPFSVPMSSVCWGNADPEADMRIIGRVVINCHMMDSR